VLIRDRLGTYIDVLQIHRLDKGTPKEEIMKALNDVVESGKVRYIGASSVCTMDPQGFGGMRTDCVIDVRLGVPDAPEYCGEEWMAQVHLHAKLPQVSPHPD
jgi:hypothetical protein